MSKKFNKLARHITREYELKGYGHKDAEYIGKATAAKISRER